MQRDSIASAQAAMYIFLKVKLITLNEVAIRMFKGAIRALTKP